MINDLINDDKIRTFEEETADRETLKKLCWDIMVKNTAGEVPGKETDEAAYRQAKMRLQLLENGAAIKDMKLFDELSALAAGNPGTDFAKEFDSFINGMNYPDLAARNEALVHLLESSAGIINADGDRIRALLNEALNREVAPAELPAENNRVEKERQEADLRQTNIEKWRALSEWVLATGTIPEQAKQEMMNVLSNAIETGQAPSEREDRNLLDSIMNGSGRNSKYTYPGYYKWARENNGKDLPSSKYVPKFMEHGRHFLLGNPPKSRIYQNDGGDIFVELDDNVIPKEILNTSNLDEIADFITVNQKELDRINPLYVENLKRQAEAIVKIESLSNTLKNSAEKPALAAVRKLANGSQLQINQRALQTSVNGCWSVAYSNLLQSRGVEVSQQDIRNYRQIKDPSDAGKLQRNESSILTEDETANPFEKRDILHTLLPGTAMQEVTFSWDQAGSTKQQKKAFEDYMRKYIKEAIEIHHSPVALLVKGHYRTIVGFDGDRIIYQDSLPHGKGAQAPDRTYRDLTFSKLAQMAMDPLTPVTFDSLVEVENLPKINAAPDDKERSNPGSRTFLGIATGIAGIEMKISYSKEINPQPVNEAQEVPVQLDQPEEQVPDEPVEVQPQGAVVNTRLEDAIDDVEAVYIGDDELSGAFVEVNRMARKLRTFTEPYYEGSAVLSDDDIEKIIKEYGNLLNACDRYIREEGESVDTGFGQGRSYCIKALRGIIIEDMRALNEAMGVTSQERTLLGLIQSGRSIQAEIEKPEDITTVGGQMSSRMPVRLKFEDGKTEEGFFTKGYELTGFGEKMREFREKIRTGYGEASPEYRMANLIYNEDFYLVMDFFRRRSAQIEMLGNEKDADEVAKNPAVVRDALYPFFSLLDSDLQDELMSNKEGSVALRRNFIRMVHDATDYALNYNTNHYHSGIPKGENVDKRNTAMSTVANYLGIGNIIAGARSFEVKIGNETLKGTFQQKAAGTDIGRLKKDDEILEIGKTYIDGNYEALESPEFKQQLSDLMALDYICGNCDRHGYNMLYKTSRVNGKVIITGVRGIDNDMSFGTKVKAENGAYEKIVDPEDMRIMRLSTAQKVLDLSPEKMDLMLKDMNFTKEELEACHKRLKKLQDRLKTDMDLQKKTGSTELSEGSILVVPDEKFGDYPISRLAEKRGGRQNENYFGRAMGVPPVLRKASRRALKDKTDKTIKYVEASAVRGKMNFVNSDVRTDIDLAATAEKLAAARESFRKLGSKWFTKDTGHYQWMKKSVEQLEGQLSALKSENPGRQIVDIPKAEAIKLESFFRQIRMASVNYVKTHPDPWTPSGKERKKVAVTMSEFRVVNGKAPKTAEKQKEKVLKEKPGVKKVSLDKLESRESVSKEASKNVRKKRERSKSVNVQKKKGTDMIIS